MIDKGAKAFREPRQDDSVGLKLETKQEKYNLLQNELRCP